MKSLTNNIVCSGVAINLAHAPKTTEARTIISQVFANTVVLQDLGLTHLNNSIYYNVFTPRVLYSISKPEWIRLQ